MDWIELILKTEPDKLNALCNTLDELGAYQYIIEDSRDFHEFVEENRQFWGMVDEDLAEHYADVSQVKIYVEDDEKLPSVIHQIAEATGITPEQSRLEQTNWDEAWKENYNIQPVGDHFEIVPVWLSPTGDRLPIIMNPGLTFGTGYHPTTQMCLSEMEGLDLKGKSVLDIGCGSGILSIGALRLGAADVVGCDIDESVPSIAMENAGYNGYDSSSFHVYCGDILKDKALKRKISRTYDLILGNLVADVVIPLSTALPDFMNPTSILIISGIHKDRITEVISCLENTGIIIQKKRSIEEWNTLYCIRP